MEITADAQRLVLLLPLVAGLRPGGSHAYSDPGRPAGGVGPRQSLAQLPLAGARGRCRATTTGTTRASKDYVDANYAIHLPLVDRLMGTPKLPPRGRWPQEYGVLKPETVPQGIVAQHVAPFVGNGERERPVVPSGGHGAWQRLRPGMRRQPLHPGIARRRWRRALPLHLAGTRARSTRARTRCGCSRASRDRSSATKAELAIKKLAPAQKRLLCAAATKPPAAGAATLPRNPQTPSRRAAREACRLLQPSCHLRAIHAKAPTSSPHVTTAASAGSAEVDALLAGLAHPFRRPSRICAARSAASIRGIGEAVKVEGAELPSRRPLRHFQAGIRPRSSSSCCIGREGAEIAHNRSAQTPQRPGDLGRAPDRCVITLRDSAHAAALSATVVDLVRQWIAQLD